MTGKQDVQPEKDQSAEAPTADAHLYASADLSTNALPRQTEVASNPTMDALEFKAPDFRAPTDVAVAPAVPADKSQEATDVANLMSAIAKGDKSQVIALQTKLLGSNNSYEGSYMGQNFRLTREKYPEKTHKIYSEAQYFHVGNNLVSRTNVRRDEAKREVQTSGSIVSVARNQYAPGSDTSVAAGNVTDGKFLNADDQRNKKGNFVQTLLPKGTDVVKQLVQKAQTANAADVRLGKGTNAFEAKVNLAGDGTISSIVGKTPLEPARPPTETKVEVTQPQTQPGQIEAFLKENKDNKARELVGSISSGDAATQAKAIRQLVDGGVRTLSFTRPGGGERPQELSFVPNQNGSIAVKLDGQMLGRISQDGRIGPTMLSQNLKNLGLESNGTVNIGIKGKDQKIELGKSPVAATPDVITKPEPLTQRIESPAIQSQKLQELAAKLGTQGYSQVSQTQILRPGDVIASVRPDGQEVIATVTGSDNEGNLLVEDGASKQVLKAQDWSQNVNPEKRNIAVIMRKLPPVNSELPPVETPTRTTDAPYMTGAVLAQQANSVRDTDQYKALDRLVSPYGIKLGPFEGSRQLSAKLSESFRFLPVDKSEPSRTGDLHILAPKGTVTADNTLAWDNQNSPGMVLAITNDKGEMVRLSDGQKVDPAQFDRSSMRAGVTVEKAPPLEAAVVYGRLFRPGQPGAIESATDPVSANNFEAKIKAPNSGFTPQGQIQFSELQSRIQNMEVGTTLMLNAQPGKERSIGIIGEVPAAPGSAERRKVLFVSDTQGGWLRADDTSLLKERTTADIYKPNEKVTVTGSAESNREFDTMLRNVSEGAFNVSSLVGDPQAKQRFYAAIKSGALPLDAIKRYLSESGDRQTDYYTARQAGILQSSFRSPIGIGVEVRPENGNVVITRPFEGSPAMNAIRLDNNQTVSLKPGDIISAVNKQSTQGKAFDDVIASLRGNLNTNVEIEIKRPIEGKPDQFETFSVSVVRKPIPSVQASIDNDGLVHVRMNSGFTETAAEDFRKEIERIKSQNGDKVKGYILDLRQNGGGVLEQSLSILSGMAPENSVLLNVRERNSSGNPPYKSYEYRLTANGIVKVPQGATSPVLQTIPRLPKGFIDKPVSVLVDGNSASASEIVASALKDFGNPVYGTKTYGKGTVQTLSADRRYKYTSAQYLSPRSHLWFGNAADIRRGIQPDVVIKPTTMNFSIGSQQDSQFMETRRLLLRNLAERRNF